MADIREFAEQAAEMYRFHQDALRENKGLLPGWLPTTKDTVIKFITAVYNASLIPDEGRYPVTCLMCYPKDNSIPPPFHTLFAEPYESSSEEIAKLAHAIDNRSHIACICEENRITLGGFHANVLYNLREYGYYSIRVGNPLKVNIKGPGYIEVSCTGSSALLFRGGNISKESPLKQSSSMKRLVTRIDKELRDNPRDLIRSLDDIFNDLMCEIARLGHGGMVIFADPPKKSHFSSLRVTHSFYFSDLLRSYWDELIRYANGAGAFAYSAAPDENQLTSLRMNLVRATDQLENCLSAIANLSGMDGAIALTFSCNIGAFNAIIDRKKAVDSEPKLVDEKGSMIEYQKAFAHRGSRHQSALLYASSVPDSFVFVISQDGSISAFHNPSDGTVICEFGLRPLE